jgi:hypothetical protein
METVSTGVKNSVDQREPLKNKLGLLGWLPSEATRADLSKEHSNNGVLRTAKQEDLINAPLGL